jgi:hypothetical protein
MRTFWILIGLLVLAAAAFAVFPLISGTSNSTPNAMNSPPVAELPGKKNDETAQKSTPSSPATPAAAATSERAQASAIENPESAQEARVAKEQGVAPESKPATAVTQEVAKPKSAEPMQESAGPATGAKPDTSNSPTLQEEKIKKDEAVVEDVIEKALGGGAAPAAPADGAEKKLELKQTPVKIERKGDTEVLLDGTFTVKGLGTKESPYIAPWELVIAAQDTYDPGQKKDEIPGAVMFLDGKHVRLTGYVCFPMYVPEPKEMLSMLNQWDGCCIGVPPTPYDAVEVHLAKKVNSDDRYAVYGNVEGVFRVKPYLSGNWLVGLYVLEEATFKPSDKGGGS